MTLIVIAAIAFAVAAVFPYLVYPRTLDHFASRPIHRVSGAPLPSATLLFCAYNEAASAPAKLDNLRAIRAVCPAMRFHNSMLRPLQVPSAVLVTKGAASLVPMTSSRPADASAFAAGAAFCAMAGHDEAQARTARRR